MEIELKILSGIRIDGKRVGKPRDAVPTGKWRIVNKDGDATLYLEVTFTKMRQRDTGETSGLFRNPVYEWVGYDETQYIPEGSLSLKVTYDNECGGES